MNERQALLHNLHSQVDELKNELVDLGRRSDRYTNVRLVTFVLGGVASGATLVVAGLWSWLAVTGVALIPFITAVYFHRDVEENIIRNRIQLRLKQNSVARMTLDWKRIPATVAAAPDPQHPFALDLDLVGERSVHQLMDTAVTQEGSQRLSHWMLNTSPDPALICRRRECVEELLGLPTFRDELSLNGMLVPTESSEKWPGKRMLNWIKDQRDLSSLRLALVFLIPMALVNVTLALLGAAGVIPHWWVITWLLYIAVAFAQVRKIGTPFHDAFFLRDGLDRLSQVFDFLETYPYGGKNRLTSLCEPFLGENNRPSEQLRQVKWVVAAMALRRNQILWLWLNAVLPWDIYFTHRLNQNKQKLAVLLPVWLDVWFELEALSSLASFAHLNPEATFPEIRPGEIDIGQELISGRSMGHPLIPFESRICNDFAIEKPGSVYIITGSNMSGKSTFLRTLGVNIALAYTGGPVVAHSMDITMFRLFTAVKVSDSLVDGFSYFYAEVRRLKSLMVALEHQGGLPLFYLIDEIFRGTNNRERLIGSRAFVRALAGGNGVGVIATHDLELVKLAERLPLVENYHFRDDVQDGRMVFDYKLHSGPCPTTNALEIMRLAGLPVEDEQ
jgi:hypothetical protein